MTRFPNDVFQKMTKEEQMELALRGLCGFHQYDSKGNVTVLMGSWAIKNLENYEKEMIEKYKNK